MLTREASEGNSQAASPFPLQGSVLKLSFIRISSKKHISLPSEELGFLMHIPARLSGAAPLSLQYAVPTELE